MKKFLEVWEDAANSVGGGGVSMPSDAVHDKKKKNGRHGRAGEQASGRAIPYPLTFDSATIRPWVLFTIGCLKTWIPSYVASDRIASPN